MERRTFIKSAALIGALPLSSTTATSSTTGALFEPTTANGWQNFELTTSLTIDAASEPLQVWLPLPSHTDALWTKPLANQWSSNAHRVEIKTDAHSNTQMLHAQWDGSQGDTATLELTSGASIRDRAVDWQQPLGATPLSAADHQRYTSATEHLPIDGIVATTAHDITDGKLSERAKARAIYDWIVHNTLRDPKTHACGTGNIKAMLETGNLKGKCADLNTLFVGLARAAGIPARDVYGIRIGDSRFGYRSLGKSGDVSKAQHCRAEVYLEGHGWVAADPADVRKVMLEEEKPNTLPLDNAKVQAVYNKLFGAWENNWLAFNTAHDVQLPGSTGKAVPFFMYPHGERADGSRIDGTHPDSFSFTLNARELTA